MESCTCCITTFPFKRAEPFTKPISIFARSSQFLGILSPKIPQIKYLTNYWLSIWSPIRSIKSTFLLISCHDTFESISQFPTEYPISHVAIWSLFSIWSEQKRLNWKISLIMIKLTQWLNQSAIKILNSNNCKSFIILLLFYYSSIFLILPVINHSNKLIRTITKTI